MYAPTERTRLRRLPERASYDRDTVHAILDEGFICHVGFVLDGKPCVIPTGYARVGDTLYLHGSTGSRLGLHPGVEVCVTVTLLDGIVLARSAFHHSFQYRSVVAYGRTREAVRGGISRELAATAVLALPLAEASAKVRSGPPKDEEEDYELPIWAGTLPLSLTAGSPEPDPLLAPDVPVPAHVTGWRRPTPPKE